MFPPKKSQKDFFPQEEVAKEEQLVKDFLETMKRIRSATQKKLLTPFIFSQSKGLITLVLNIIDYKILEKKLTNLPDSKKARFVVEVFTQKKEREYILLAKTTPRVKKWRIYSFERSDKILEQLKIWVEFMKNPSERKIFDSNPQSLFEIGVALLQWGEDEEAIAYLQECIEKFAGTEPALAAKICLSILKNE